MAWGSALKEDAAGPISWSWLRNEGRPKVGEVSKMSSGTRHLQSSFIRRTSRVFPEPCHNAAHLQLLRKSWQAKSARFSSLLNCRRTKNAETHLTAEQQNLQPLHRRNHRASAAQEVHLSSIAVYQVLN